MTKTSRVGPWIMSTVALSAGLFSNPVATEAQADSTLTKVRATGVDSLTGDLQVFYSPGQEVRARSLHDLLAEADDHLAAQLGVQVDFSLAVLDETEWGDVWPFPYGLPYLSLGTPWTAVVPTSPARSVLFPDFERMLGPGAAAQMVDNIGFHEVGHVYVSEFVYSQRVSGAPPVRWLDELLATYLAYAFLKSVSSARAEVWDQFASSATAGPRPNYTSLASFEAEYYGYLGSPEGTANYSWYQAVFAQHAAAIYDEYGLQFITDLRERLLTSTPSSWTTESLLETLELLAPGTNAWAEQLTGPAGGA